MMIQELEPLKRGDRYLVDHGTTLKELTVLEVSNHYVRVNRLGWMHRKDFRIKAKQLIGRTFILFGVPLWRIK